MSATPRRAVDALSLLRNLVPTKRILGLVVLPSPTSSTSSTSTPFVGCSLSDPYLSHARPVQVNLHLPIDNLLLPKLMKISTEEDVGAWLVGLPLLMDVNITKDAAHMRLRDDFLTLVVKSTSLSVPPFCISKVKPGNIDYIHKEHTANIQWDSIPIHSLLDAEASEHERAGVHASVALQMWLDEHCGGWANTFG